MIVYRTGRTTAVVLLGSLAHNKIAVARMGLGYQCKSSLHLELLKAHLTGCLDTMTRQGVG